MILRSYELLNQNFSATADEFVSIINGGITPQLSKDFGSLDEVIKQLVLIDERVSPDMGEELLKGYIGATDVLTNEIADKLAQNCNSKCQQEKIDASAALQTAKEKSKICN